MAQATRGLAAASILAAAATMTMTMTMTGAMAQGVGFLTERERLASYCAGVFEARLRELDEFLEVPCAGSHRKECADAADARERAQAMDRRLWAGLAAQIFTSKEPGPREAWRSRRWPPAATIGWPASGAIPASPRGAAGLPRNAGLHLVLAALIGVAMTTEREATSMGHASA